MRSLPLNEEATNVASLNVPRRQETEEVAADEDSSESFSLSSSRDVSLREQEPDGPPDLVQEGYVPVTEQAAAGAVPTDESTVLPAASAATRMQKL
eukprot:7385119-Prymnesium_polylepis.1